MRFKHADTVQKLKSSFLNEKKSFQAGADAKVADMQKKANAVRVMCIANLVLLYRSPYGLFLASSQLPPGSHAGSA